MSHNEDQIQFAMDIIVKGFLHKIDCIKSARQIADVYVYVSRA